MKEYTNKVKRELEKNGDKRITAMRIARRPINNIIEKALDLVSIGKWSQLRKKYYYDKLFHLSLQLTLEDGTVYSFEKFDVVSLYEEKRCSDKGVECTDITEYEENSLTLNDLVKNPLDSMSNESYFVYSPFEFNCQAFISGILKHHGLLSDKNKNFINQDLKDIISNLPTFTKWFAKTFTDISAKIKELRGDGVDGIYA